MRVRFPRAESSREAVVTMRDGRTLTLHRRLEFESRSHAKNFIHDFALAQGKRARLDPHMSGGRNFVYICNSTTKCDFIVRGARVNRKLKGATGGTENVNAAGYYVTSFHADHGAECSGKTAITQRQVVNQLLIAQEAASATLAATSSSSSSSPAVALTGFDVQSIVKSVHGTSVPPRMAYRAKDVLAGKTTATTTTTTPHSGNTISTSGTSIIRSNNNISISSSVVADIQQVESLLTQFQLLNPSASVHVGVDAENHFERAFLKLPHASLMQRCGARILGFDGMEMSRSSGFQGWMMLELVTKDGNNDPVVLAVALCDGPTAANYAWFFSCCVSSGLAFDVPMLCDRSNAALASGIAEALQPPTGAVPAQTTPPMLIQCTQHLIDNLEKLFSPSSVSKEWQKFVWRAQAADTYDDFEAALSALSLQHAKVAENLRSNVDRSTWAKHCFLRKTTPLYNWQTTTLTESENPIAVAAKHLSSFDFFQKYMERAMNDLYVRKTSAKEWLESGRVLSAFADDVLEEQKVEAAACCVSPSDRETGSAYVWDTRSAIPKKRRVNVSANSCSCAYADQLGLPCKHLVAAVLFFNKSGASWDVRNLCQQRVYSAQSYFESYGLSAAIQIPVEEELARNPAVKVKQMVVVSATKRCSLCHTFGHNKRNCTTTSRNNNNNSNSVSAGVGAGSAVL